MRLVDRQNLITRAFSNSGGAGELFGTTVTFPGFTPVPARRRASAFTATLRLGGESRTAPTVFYLLKSEMPVGLLATLKAKSTKLSEGSTSYLVESIDNEPSEPQIRLTCNLSSR